MAPAEPEQMAPVPDELAEYDPQDEIVQKLDEMDSLENATFRVYRQPSGNSSKMEFLFTTPTDKYSFDELLSHIRDEYGGGDYRIHLRAPKGGYANQIIANKLFTIATPRQKEAPAQQTSELAPVLNRLIDRMDKTDERIAAMQSQPPQAPVNPMDQMEQMARMMGIMREMMPGAAPQAPQKSLLEQVKELKEFQEMAGDLAGGEDKSGFSELVKTGLGPMIEMMQEEAKARKEAREKGENYSARGLPATTKPNPSPETEPMDEGTKAMLGNVRTLLMAAKKGGDPEVYATIVLDFVPEQKYLDLYNFLSLPDCIDTVVTHFPEAKEHRDWFEALRAAILIELEPEEGADDPTGDNAGSHDPDRAAAGASGHAQDPADHGQGGSASENASADSSHGNGNRAGDTG